MAPRKKSRTMSRCRDGAAVSVRVETWNVSCVSWPTRPRRERADLLAAVADEFHFTAEQAVHVTGDTEELRAVRRSRSRTRSRPSSLTPPGSVYRPMVDRLDVPRDLGAMADGIRSRPL